MISGLLKSPDELIEIIISIQRVALAITSAVNSRTEDNSYPKYIWDLTVEE